jgi:hypothetical protein
MQHVFGSKHRTKNCYAKTVLSVGKVLSDTRSPGKSRKLAIAPEVLRNERRLRKFSDLKLV